MHPFHRLSRYIPPHKSCSNPRKEPKGVDAKDRDDNEYGTPRKMSPCRTRPRRDERDTENYPQVSVPLINVSPAEMEMRQANATINILKAKEMALWSNTSPDWSDDTERLGPNKNSIIEESLKSK